MGDHSFVDTGGGGGGAEGGDAEGFDTVAVVCAWVVADESRLKDPLE